MKNNQNDYKQTLKINEKALWILIGIIFVSLIAFIVIICNNNPSPVAATIPWVLIIGSFITIFILAKIRVPIVEKAKQEHIQEIKDSQIIESLSYTANTKTLTVMKRSKYIEEFLSAEQIYVDMSDKKPDSLVFTSATVGGITTGGIEKVEGKTTTRKTASGRYKLYYNAMTESGDFWKQGEVEYIRLSSDLLTIANKDINIKKYINYDRIEILDENLKKNKMSNAGVSTVLNAAMNVGGNTLASNYVNNLEVIEYPDYSKISKIRNWLMAE